MWRIFDKDRAIEILQVFVANPFRTFLSGLGVGWGLFMIIVTVGASNGLENGVAGDLGGRVKNSMFFWLVLKVTNFPILEPFVETSLINPNIVT